MCGRFIQHYTWGEIHELYGLVGAARNIEPRYNIAPTDTIDVVIPTSDGLKLAPMRWGLVPPWWEKSAKETPPSFNARTESIAETPMFRLVALTAARKSIGSTKKSMSSGQLYTFAIGSAS
jgi:putative SOS response-associated peptidase YedK